tara:strand:- start:29 stop:1591 length:1563 start_codon:yes stop_codon:yes gene_type:complete
MPAVVTDQFRILNASNFVNTVTGIGGADPTDSFYVTLGLPNAEAVGFGRTSDFDDETPAPIDNINTNNHLGDTTLFGKRVTGKNIRRLIRKVDWTQGQKYEMYRHDYSINFKSPNTQSARLYDARYYVMNENFNIYICIDNGSSGINTTGNASQDQPIFTDLEPSRAGESGDGYIWKFLYTVSPSDIIKFDSTEFISVPNDWETTNDAAIQSVRENGNSDINNNQIKKVYIDNPGKSYKQVTGLEVPIFGDGTGAKVVIDTNAAGEITNAVVSSGGKGYTYGIVDLSNLNSTSATKAKLIPIIPPSKGHGHNVYEELGTDRVLCYARFGGDNKDFPIDTKFAQVTLLKNPTSIGTTSTFFNDSFSSLKAIKFPPTTTAVPSVGQKLSQSQGSVSAVGYVASYDNDTKVLKYFQDRSLYFDNGVDQTDYVGVGTEAQVIEFVADATKQVNTPTFSAAIDTSFNSGIATVGVKNIDLGINFTNGLATSEINKGSGDIIYIDNRATITRNSRQKEDIKIILEF